MQRRLLTKQRIVNSIDAAVNLENYNPFPIPHEMRTIESVFKVDNKKQINDIKRTFQNQPPTGNVGRNNRANVITGRQGPQPKATNTPSLRAAFELYFTNELVSSIVSCTNKTIRRTLSVAEDLIAQNSRYSYMKETTVEEMYAFIGLYLNRGLYKLNTLSVDKLFSNQYGPPIFSAAMSRNRLCFYSRQPLF